jgi:hypothetical protein
MTDQYKYLETPEEAFAALLAQSNGGPRWWNLCSAIGWSVCGIVRNKFRVPLPPVVTVMYHVHGKEGLWQASADSEDQARYIREQRLGRHIVKHIITNGVATVEVVK